MKTKKRLLFIILTLLILILSGCKKNKDITSINTTLTDQNDLPAHTIVITNIIIDTAEANPDNIWRVNWPDGYYSQGISRTAFDNIQNMAEDDPLFIYNFINGLPDITDVKPDNVYLGEIFLTYDIIDGDKSSSSMLTKAIYDKYPEGYSDFIAIINRICGGDRQYLCMNKAPQEITPEYVTYRTGLTDNDVKNGTLQDVIDVMKLDIHSLNWHTPTEIAKYCRDYPALKYLPFDQKTAPSTDDAALNYACSLAAKMDVDSANVAKTKAPFEDIEFYAFSVEDFATVRVYRTEALSNVYTEKGDYGQWELRENTTSRSDELQGYKMYNFIYSNDYAFAVAIEADYTIDDKALYEKLATLGNIIDSID